ncbi:hypothetical protein H072_88 [Dactylellina haptotyla CBS 200.50]|uniref:RNI-like protein n=1 Tax=Dactylellina haptotyla (strain CBS 200.50) TaxID=1284197 RepID=S8C2J6_DACHA|nr:hypothetical protein H072_88 [Dactylellina haptotyla CBS 200.50]
MATAVQLDLTGIDTSRIMDRLMFPPAEDGASAPVGPTCGMKKSGDQGNISAKWVQKIKSYGRWDQQVTPQTVLHPPSLPMPVEIAPYSELEPFFTHLMKDMSAEDFKATFDESGQIKEETERMDDQKFEPGYEPYYKTEFLEFKRGVVYSDKRMDLCKMVVGPSIAQLMESLETNKFIEHFLLGNNIIGPDGAHAIAKFLEKRPCAMRTWYLAGNCIDTESFTILVDAMAKSHIIENLWFKRNPLGPGSHESLFKLLSQLPRLRTLDLDQTDLGDDCLAIVFDKLSDHFSDFLPIAPPSPLHSLYLNGVGILPAQEGKKTAINHISKFISQQTCQLTSLYLANNLLGDSGCKVLAEGLSKNRSIERLSLQSVGAGTEGVSALLEALAYHPTIRMIDIGQSYATIDLKMQFNWLEDGATESAVNLINNSETLRYLDLGYTNMTQASLNTISQAIAKNRFIQFYNARTLKADERSREGRAVNQEANRLKNVLRDRLHANVKDEYPDMTYDQWFAEERRWLVNDKDDVRAIDSVYRNRDAGMARRGQMVLKKWWTEDNEDILKKASGKSCEWKNRPKEVEA